MNNETSVLCTICARGGSKGLKNKNIKDLCGLPLIAHTIKVARDSKLFKAIAVSSDSDEILMVSKEHGADFTIKRPEELASDTAGKIPAIKHAAMEIEKQTNMKFDFFFDLDATSPLRIKEDIHGVFNLLKSGKFKNVITGAPARRSPYFNLVEEDDNGFVDLSKKSATPILRRQDAPNCYDMNASIYGWTRESFNKMESTFEGKTGIFVMPEERSIDIDNPIDFKIVELLMKERF